MSPFSYLRLIPGRGTPNSGTTSLSALSTTAIKDGHQGHTAPHHHGHMHTHSSASNNSANTLDAERADRISRLAGLERVATLRGASVHLAPGTSYGQPAQPAGYFDNSAGPQVKDRSTVGSASATGSAGGRTRTWASGSDMYEPDKMSEDPDDGVSSSAGLSDEGNASLVGFGEAASSTISGPVSGPTRIAADSRGVGGSPTTLKQGKATEASPAMLDGVARGRDTIDAASLGGQQYYEDVSMTGLEHPEAAVNERLDDSR